MFFTLDDYIKILKWLYDNSIKDSELPDSLPLKGNECIAIVLDGVSVKVNIKEFIEWLLSLGIQDTINATYRFNTNSLEESILAIPIKARKKGLIITFIDSNNNWRAYQYRGDRLNLWNSTTLWVNIFNSFNSTERPILSENDRGVQYYDVAINKPIWWDGNKWIEANGTLI